MGAMTRDCDALRCATMIASRRAFFSGRREARGQRRRARLVGLVTFEGFPALLHDNCHTHAHTHECCSDSSRGVTESNPRIPPNPLASSRCLVGFGVDDRPLLQPIPHLAA